MKFLIIFLNSAIACKFITNDICCSQYEVIVKKNVEFFLLENVLNKISSLCLTQKVKTLQCSLTITLSEVKSTFSLQINVSFFMHVHS